MIHVSFALTYIQIYLIVITLTSFVLYMYDKFQAFDNSKNSSRVSELKLLTSSLLGGTLGSILAMLIFRHKVKKSSFIIKFSLVMILQVIFLYLYFNSYLNIK